VPYRGAYNASKYALEGLTDTLRLELTGTGIYISLIESGPIKSRFRDNAYVRFKQHIDVPTSVHRSVYAQLEQRLLTQGAVIPFTLPPQAVLKKVIQALEAPRPQARYYVTVPTYLLATLKRLFSSRTLDWIIRHLPN
jgi:short-subunit dehydrogenase